MSGQKPFNVGEVELTKNMTQGFEIVENTEAALFGVDRNWNITYVNRAAENLLQRERQSLINKNIWQCFPHLANSSIGKTYLQAMETGEYSRIEDFYEPKGQWFNVHINPHP